VGEPPGRAPADLSAAAQRDNAKPRSADRLRLSGIERRGSWVLAGAAVVAWTLALWQAEHDTVAAAWAVGGFVLLVAAAFFNRVVEVTREGVKLDHVLAAIEDAPVEPGDTSDEVKAKVLDEVKEKVVERTWFELYTRTVAEGEGSSDPFTRAAVLERSWRAWRESNLVATFTRWLEGQGWEVRREGLGDKFRADLQAVRDGETLRAEVRSAVRALRTRDAVAITISPELRPDGARRAVVLAQGTELSESAGRVLRDAGIEIYLVNPDADDPASSVRLVE
jgi:hypothetical protein